VDVIDLRKRLGMVFQKPNPFPMSIFENVVYPLRIDGVRQKSVLREACEHALRGAALWDEVKDRLKSAGPGALGRPAAAAVHRAGDRVGPRGAAAR
jgi:phosphate transport system ATP-binding protein